jgi:hypothetical protein
MKTQIKINLLLATGGSLMFLILVSLDPAIGWRESIGVYVGIWSMIIPQSVVHFLAQNKTTHEKDHHTTPTP